MSITNQHEATIQLKETAIIKKKVNVRVERLISLKLVVVRLVVGQRVGHHLLDLAHGQALASGVVLDLILSELAHDYNCRLDEQ